ncbi:MAG: type I methionyl aminopeptidase [Bacillota bacterium]|nr:type I methionyl aminopeptidase [Bacillota bacterium]
MIIIKSPREIALMKEAGRILAVTFKAMKEAVKPGVSTKELNDEIARIFAENGGESAEKGYYGYPADACISVNEVILHGIPSAKKILRDGDIVSIDLVVKKDGYMADACRTYPVGIVGERQLAIIKASEKCFWEGVSLVKEGVHLGDIEAKIGETAHSLGYNVPRDYTGHGIGSEMHEDPYIPNYGKPGTGPILREGMTLCFEPMLLEGKADVRTLNDGWSVLSKDGKLTSHYENTVLVTKDGYEILTYDGDPASLSGLSND